MAHLGVEVGPVVDDVDVGVHLPGVDGVLVAHPRQLEALEARRVALRRVEVLRAAGRRYLKAAGENED